jgi:hypothetical protein
MEHRRSFHTQEGPACNPTRITVSRARAIVQEIRHELFEFPEVLDVVVTGRPDWLVVVSPGRPRPREWLRALRAVGYHVPVRRHATLAAEADRQGAAAPASTPGPGFNRASRRPSARLRARSRRAGVRGASPTTMTGSVPPGRTERSIVAGLRPSPG